VSEDAHSPTSAGPEPAGPEEPAAVVQPDPATAAAQPPAPDPSPTVGAGAASFQQPAGSALLGGGEEVDPHPEKLVGAAFAGGLVAAVLLKGLARRRHA
jgi:hypothetical protein